MKAAKGNNPVVIGVLLCVLLVAVIKTVSDLRSGGDLPTIKLARTSAPSASATVRKSLAVPTERGSRNPFSRPVAYRVAPTGIPGTQNGTTPAAQFPAPLRGGLPPFSIRPLGTEKAVGSSVNAVGNAERSKGAEQTGKSGAEETPTLAQQESDLAARLKLTAIVGGKRRCALIETPENAPQLLNVGDSVQSLRLVAVNAEEVVLAGTTGIWTLPLTTTSKDNTHASE